VRRAPRRRWLEQLNREQMLFVVYPPDNTNFIAAMVALPKAVG